MNRRDLVQVGGESASAVVMPQRRELVLGGTFGLAMAACGLLSAVPATATERLAFEATSFDEALRALGAEPAASTRIVLDLPARIEDGAVVPVTIRADLNDVTAVYVLAETNPVPLAVGFDIPPGTVPALGTRIKLNGSGVVHAVVRAGGQLYRTSREAMVLVGGCT